MSELPRYVLDRFERRWASRVAQDAAVWRSQKPPHTAAKEIVDRAGRAVPVSFRRAPLRRAAIDRGH
jgi:hypothetical protein